jgi:hypothetical protein
MGNKVENPLSRFVRNKMREEHLSRRDVSIRSGGLIGETYVGAITSGTCTNVTVEKLKALARGLGIDEMELAAVAFGEAAESWKDDSAAADHSFLLINVKKKVLMSADVAEITRQLIELGPRERSAVLKFVTRLVKEKARKKEKTQRRERA